ncbi:hypothetical protein GCM10009122_56990 [Fulvivirga kasyanovii]
MNPEPYLLFKERCVDELHNLQEEFKKVYDIDSHTNWEYDHGLGIFTIKYPDREYYFEYVGVGSYSNKTRTWKWSWDNEYTPDDVKKGMLKIPEFGKVRGYDELTTGLFDGDGETGWQMTAIANNLLKGFGAYKATSGHLDIYFLFINEVEKESYDKLRKRYVKCGEHGSRRRAFVCQHLNSNTKTGFEEAFPTYPDMEFEYEDDDFQAWCDECESVRVKYDGWNEESEKFAKIKLICEKCYFDIKEFNLGYKEG